MTDDKVWIVYYDEGYLGGYSYTLYHICSTEEKAKEMMLKEYRQMHDDEIFDYYDDHNNHGMGIKEWSVL